MPQNKIPYLDLIRATAIIAVIFIHVSTPSAYQFNQISHFDWWVAIISDSLSRFAVPSFLMITGLLLLDPKKEDSLGSFLNKRFAKVIIPLVLWTVIYSTKTSLETGQPLASLLRSAVSKPAYYHLWYLYSLIGLYLVIPFIRLATNTAPRKLIETYLLLWFIGSVIFPLSDKFLHLPVAINNQYFTGFIGYLVLGFYISKYKISFRLVYPFSLIGLLVTIFGTYFLTRQNLGHLDEFFFDPVAPNIIIYSLGIFLFLKNHPQKNWLIKTISGCSLGIYLIHPLAIELLSSGILGFNFYPSTMGAPIGIPIFSALILIISLSATLILKKIPLLKYLSP
ncbi:MAG: acyltransferase family protein [Desulfobacula sp.]|jgi:surface polysaccharide O-acyltransferase-like enzyme